MLLNNVTILSRLRIGEQGKELLSNTRLRFEQALHLARCGGRIHFDAPRTLTGVPSSNNNHCPFRLMLCRKHFIEPCDEVMRKPFLYREARTDVLKEARHLAQPDHATIRNVCEIYMPFVHR